MWSYGEESRMSVYYEVYVYLLLYSVFLECFQYVNENGKKEKRSDF